MTRKITGYRQNVARMSEKPLLDFNGFSQLAALERLEMSSEPPRGRIATGFKPTQAARVQRLNYDGLKVFHNLYTSFLLTTRKM